MGIVCRRFFVLHSPHTWTLGCGFIEHVRVAIESATILVYSSAVISPFLSLPFPYLPFPPSSFPPTTFHTPPPQERSQEHRTHAARLVNRERTRTNASGRRYRGHSTGSRGQFGPCRLEVHKESNGPLLNIRTIVAGTTKETLLQTDWVSENNKSITKGGVTHFSLKVPARKRKVAPAKECGTSEGGDM